MDSAVSRAGGKLMLNKILFASVLALSASSVSASAQDVPEFTDRYTCKADQCSVACYSGTKGITIELVRTETIKAVYRGEFGQFLHRVVGPGSGNEVIIGSSMLCDLSPNLDPSGFAIK